MSNPDRKTYIGGGAIAAALGVSPWCTPLKQYRLMVGDEVEDENDKERQKIFNRGKRAEPAAIDMLIDEYGLQVTKRSPPEAPNRYTHPIYPWAKAEIDFEFVVTPEIVETCEGLIDPSLIGTIQNGEIKSVHPSVAHKWGEMLTEEVPFYYAAQSMWGLAVTDRQFCLYGTLVGFDDLTLYGVKRDEETIAGMTDIAVRFWNCVQTRTPPDPINMGDVNALMYRVNGRPIEATPEMAEMVTKLKSCRSTRKGYEADEEQIKFEIAAFLFHNLKELNARDPRVTLEDKTALMFAGKTILTWTSQDTTRLDTKKIKEVAPEIYNQFAKTTSSRVMRPK